MSDDGVMAQIAALKRMTTPQLKLEWEKLFDRPPPAFNRRFLESRLAYAKLLMRLQKFEAAAAEFDILAAQEKNEFVSLQGEMGRLDAWRELGILEDRQKQWERELQQNPGDAKKLGQLARLLQPARTRRPAR